MRATLFRRMIAHLIPVAAMAAAFSCRAASLEKSDDLDIDWTNLVRVGALYQLNALPPVATQYYCGSAVNCGGDSGFSQGRVDWLSAMSVTGRGFGLHASLEARKDEVADDANYLQLFEAYASGSIGTLGDRPLTVLIGRHSVIWGESLHFASNAIAGAQSPIDSSERNFTLYDQSTRFLPVGQASFTWQMSSRFALVGYRQFEWRGNRVDPNDVYASEGDVLGTEATRMILLPVPKYGPVPYWRADGTTPSSGDQFGLGMKWHVGAFDGGLYGLKFDAKTPVITYYREDRSFSLDYARGIGLLGISLTGPVAEETFSAELSGRHHMPLVEGGLSNGDGDRGDGARGDTIHGQMSLTGEAAPRSFLPGGATANIEIAANHLIAVTDNRAQLLAGRTRTAAALRGVFAPRFFQLLPRLDLSLPISAGYNFLGLSQVLPDMNRGTGDIGIGAAATLDEGWTATLSYTHYFGSNKTPVLTFNYGGQPMADWDHVGMSLQVSF